MDHTKSNAEKTSGNGDIPKGMSADISGFLSLLRTPGDVFEIRSRDCPDKRGGGFLSTHSGYFRDPTIAHTRAGMLERLEPPAVYMTLNPVKPTLLARCKNEIIGKTKATTTDADILRREFLLVDIDPTRDSGISSTDAEMQAALNLAYHIRDDRAADGWPDPLLCMSGNGAYLIYRVELPNDDTATDLVRRVLHGLAERYDTDAATVDCSTFNAGRLCKLIGTTARKGSDLVGEPDIEDRPHRQSWYEPPTHPLNPVPRDLLEAIAVAPESKSSPSSSASPASNGSDRFLKYIRQCPDAIPGQHGHNATLRVACEGFRFGLSDDQVLQGLREYNATKSGGEAWNEKEMSHKVASAHRKVEAAGEFGKHLGGDRHARNGQQQKNDPENYALESGTPVRPRDRDNMGTVVSDKGRTVVVNFVSLEGDGATKEYPKSHLAYADGKPIMPGCQKTLDVIPIREFAGKDYRPQWLVRRILVANQIAVCGGRSKAMKTSALIDLAISVATGTPFLGTFETTRATVAMLSGESGAFTIQETAKRIAQHRGINLLDASLYFGFTLPQITSWEDVEATAAMMLNTEADLLIVDPAYLCLLNGDTGGRQASNVFDMGPILLRLSEVGLQTNSTVLLCHHCRKSPTEGRDRYDPPELEDLSQSGFAEWARQWLLLGRRERFEPGTGCHKLWLNIGGSVGMSGCWSVDINEGVLADDFTGRTWDVSVGSMDEAREAKKLEQQKRESAKREGKQFEHRQKVIRVLRAHKEGLSKRKLRDKSNIGTEPLSDVLMDMQQRGEVRCFDGKSGNQSCDIYALTEQAG
jgi:hypothetical protein